MRDGHVRRTRSFRVLVVSEKFHGAGSKGRRCLACGSSWTVTFDRTDPDDPTVQVFRDGKDATPYLLDWYGKSAAVECCDRQ